MGSQNSKFGHESMTSNNRRENALGLITSNSKSGMDVRNRQNSGFNSFKDTNLVNTSFKWTHGGNNVFLTGTFTGWTDHYPLQKIGNEFTGILRLPRGEYYYKFIVDGEWKFSPSDPTKRDEMGNTNNYLNTTNIESMNKMMESNSQVRKSEFSDSKTTIESNQLIEDAPVLPAHLKGIYFLNEKDRKKEEEDEYFDREVDPAEFEIDKYINFEAKSARKEFISNKNVLAPPTHVTLNHLGIYGGGPTNDNNYCVTTMTQRFKSKYATIKFHSSKFTQIH